MTIDMDIYMRRLHTVARNMGLDPAGEKTEHFEVDTSGMTKYEVGRYKVALMISNVREDTKALDDLKTDAPNYTSKKAEISNRIRRNLSSMKQKTQELKPIAMKDGKQDDFGDLCRHMKKTESMYRQRYRVGMGQDDTGAGYGTMAPSAIDPGASSTALGRSMPQFTSDEPLLDPQEDPEFQQFFLEAQRRDQAIDQGLVRVHEGLGRLKYTALETQAELQRQEVMLDNVNQKATDMTRRLQGLNGKLKETVENVEKDKYCCYIICLLLILGLLGLILSQTNVI